jgi:hypothetical protein
MLYKLLLVLLPFVISGDDHLIDWSASRKLTWDDFQARPDVNSPMVALTSSTIKIEFGFNDKLFTHSISCRFNKQKSWVTRKNDYILKHEQGHFDITEIHARILKKELLAYKFNGKTVNKDINDIYNDVMKQHVSTQQTYDLQTNHSIDSTKQRLWDNKIDSLLKLYKNWEKYK